MGNLGLAKFFCIVAALTVATTIVSSAQTFHSENFNLTNGAQPDSPLLQGVDGNLYGTTSNGGPTSYCSSPWCGTVFKVTPGGKLTTLYRLCSQPNCADGADTFAGLTQGANGNFYGVTAAGGGTIYNGTVFEITPSGKLTTLYSFCSVPNCADGSWPSGGLVQATNGNFYGTTQYGGSSTYCVPGCGTVFEITPQGKLTTLHTFCSEASCADGSMPNTALVQAADGNLYGTTIGGGSGAGVIFRLTLQGKMTTFYTFSAEAQGANPNNLTEAAGGSLYGTTGSGSGPAQGGTIFTITLGGKLTVLTTFCVQREASCIFSPRAGLVQASDGNFYGTTIAGGDYDQGAIFEVTPSGELTTLYSFCPCDTLFPLAPMTQGTDGTLYGTTDGNSLSAYGALFSWNMNLPPFVEPSPNFGRVGKPIGILGNKLASATGVTFNGVPATFAIESDTFIWAMVPSGATTGTVKVTLLSKTLSSNIPFRVLP